MGVIFRDFWRSRHGDRSHRTVKAEERDNRRVGSIFAPSVLPACFCSKKRSRPSRSPVVFQRSHPHVFPQNRQRRQFLPSR